MGFSAIQQPTVGVNRLTVLRRQLTSNEAIFVLSSMAVEAQSNEVLCSIIAQFAAKSPVMDL